MPARRAGGKKGGVVGAKHERYADARRLWAADGYSLYEKVGAVLVCGQLARLAAEGAYSWVAPVKRGRFFFICDAANPFPTALPALCELEEQLLQAYKRA